MAHTHRNSTRAVKRAVKQCLNSTESRALRKRRRLRSPLSLKITSSALNSPNGQFKFSDNLPFELEREKTNTRKVQPSKELKSVKKSCNIEKKKNNVIKGSCSFRREFVIVCTVEKESKGHKRFKEQTVEKMNDHKHDSKAVKNRLVAVVRARPCARNRMPCDRRKMRKIRLFDPSKIKSKGKSGNESMLQRAKRRVIKELNRQKDLGRYKPSPLEQAFFDATNENFLAFDYERMKTLVRNARFCNSREQKDFQAYDDAYNDNINIVLNRNIPFVESEICITLLHECLHNTVERSGKPGNPQLSAQNEHTAMALLGDREEQQEYFEKYFNLDYVNESWLKVRQRKKRRRNPKYLTNVYDYESND